MTTKSTNNDSISLYLLHQIDEATATMSDRDRVIYLAGLSLGIRVAATAMTDLALAIKNAVPDLLDRPPSIRRIGL